MARDLPNYCLGVRHIITIPVDGSMPTIRNERMTKAEIAKVNKEINPKRKYVRRKK